MEKWVRRGKQGKACPMIACFTDLEFSLPPKTAEMGSYSWPAQDEVVQLLLFQGQLNGPLGSLAISSRGDGTEKRPAEWLFNQPSERCWALQAHLGLEILDFLLTGLNIGKRPVWKFWGGDQEPAQTSFSGAKDHLISQPSPPILLYHHLVKSTWNSREGWGNYMLSVSWRMGFWRSGQALHSEGLTSQRLKLWRILAGSWLFLMQSRPFPSTSHASHSSNFKPLFWISSTLLVW